MENSNRILEKAVIVSHKLIRKAINFGAVVIDATVGNGNDTLFLAKIIGNHGKVYGFDIQEKALRNTKSRLYNNGMLERVTLIQDGHENIKKHVQEKISAVMFNLGYLPGEDRSIVTCPETTIQALKHSLDLLKKGGLITIVVYTGHSGGPEEADRIYDFLSNLNPNYYSVISYKFIINRLNNPPFLLAIERNQ